MKKFFLACVAIAAMGAPSFAADLAARPYTKAPAYVPAQIYNWTGFYIGGHVGGAFRGDDNNVLGGSSDGTFMLMLLANLPNHPESVPINMWNEVKGVPVNNTAERPDPIALVRMIAVARIMMPKSVVRLSAGRQYMTDELQALCFVAGANSIFIGDVLLTTKNPQTDRDTELLHRLGITSRLDEAKTHAHPAQAAE